MLRPHRNPSRKARAGSRLARQSSRGQARAPRERRKVPDDDERTSYALSGPGSTVGAAARRGGARPLPAARKSLPPIAFEVPQDLLDRVPPGLLEQGIQEHERGDRFG